MSERDPEAWRAHAGPPCPVCWHREAMRVRLHGGEPRDTEPQDHMEWHRPYGGARGQQVTRGDLGFWRCPGCQVALTPDEAAILLDAVLRHGYGIGEAAVDNWTTQAWNGGRR